MVVIRKWDDKLICERAAEYVINNLKSHGFTIMRYDSYTTNSIYLKIDEGVVGTIRISDHRGKKNLHYRYNLLTCQKELQIKRGKVEQFFLPMYYAEQLIDKVLWDRYERVNRYGFHNYNLFRQRNMQEGLQKRGFWREAKYV